MRITSAGNVGIGTATPAARLDINGGSGVIIKDTAATSSQVNIGIGLLTAGRPFVGTNDNTNPLEVGTRAAMATVFVTNSTERMRILSGGDVGIGTSSPTYKLHVAAAGVNALGVYRDLDVTSVGAAGQLIEIGARDGATFTPGAAITGVLNNPAATGYMAFSTRESSALSERMRITSAGLVGIGCTPSTALDVASPSAGTIRVQTTSSGNATLWAQSLAGGVAALDLQTATGINRIIGGLGGTPNLGLYTDNTEKMRITSDGNVGIGTSSPTVYTGYTTLELDNATNGGILSIKKAGSVVGYINGASGLLMLAQSNDLKLTTTGSTTIQFSTNATERMRIKAGGQVRFIPLAAAPGGAEAGDVYYDSTTNKLRCYNGTTWNDLF
jgi:hypothetical protein